MHQQGFGKVNTFSICWSSGIEGVYSPSVALCHVYLICVLFTAKNVYSYLCLVLEMSRKVGEPLFALSYSTAERGWCLNSLCIILGLFMPDLYLTNTK